MFKETYATADLLKNNHETFFGINGTFPREAHCDSFNPSHGSTAIREYVTVELDETTKEIHFTITGLTNFEDENAEDEDSYNGRVCGGDIWFVPATTDLTKIQTQYGYSLQENLRYAEYLIDETLTYEGTEYRLLVPMHED